MNPHLFIKVDKEFSVYLTRTSSLLQLTIVRQAKIHAVSRQQLFQSRRPPCKLDSRCYSIGGEKLWRLLSRPIGGGSLISLAKEREKENEQETWVRLKTLVAGKRDQKVFIQPPFHNLFLCTSDGYTLWRLAASTKRILFLFAAASATNPTNEPGQIMFSRSFFSFLPRSPVPFLITHRKELLVARIAYTKGWRNDDWAENKRGSLNFKSNWIKKRMEARVSRERDAKKWYDYRYYCLSGRTWWIRLKWKVEYLEHFSSVFALKKITWPSFSQVSLYMHACCIIKDEGDKTVNKKRGKRGWDDN